MQAGAILNAFTTWENNTKFEKVNVLKTVEERSCLPVQLTKSLIYENEQYNVVHTTSFFNVYIGVNENAFIPPERC